MKKWGVLSLRAGAAAGAIMALGLAASQAAAEDRAEAIEGTWLPDRYSEKMLTADGAAPPLNKEAAELYADRIADQDNPDRQYDRTRWCAGPGMPRIMFMPYPFEIRADGSLVGFIYDWYRWHRVIDMSGQEPDPILPQTMGYPVGHWDGDTLVIETVGLTDETVLDAMGLPHSEDLRLGERIRLLSDGRLEARYTINDPETYTRPWEAVMTYHRVPDVVVGDDVCPDRIGRGEPATRRALP